MMMSQFDQKSDSLVLVVVLVDVVVAGVVARRIIDKWMHRWAQQISLNLTCSRSGSRRSGCGGRSCCWLLSCCRCWNRQRLERKHHQSFDVVFFLLDVVPIFKAQRISHSNVKTIHKPEYSNVCGSLIERFVFGRDYDAVLRFKLCRYVAILPDCTIWTLNELHQSGEMVCDLEGFLLFGFWNVDDVEKFLDTEFDRIMSMGKVFRMDGDYLTRLWRFVNLEQSKVGWNKELKAWKRRWPTFSVPIKLYRNW